jgi:hypothetical protein
VCSFHSLASIPWRAASGNTAISTEKFHSKPSKRSQLQTANVYC